MEDKYWRNPNMFILKVEDIDPVTALYYDCFHYYGKWLMDSKLNHFVLWELM